MDIIMWSIQERSTCKLLKAFEISSFTIIIDPVPYCSGVTWQTVLHSP